MHGKTKRCLQIEKPGTLPNPSVTTEMPHLIILRRGRRVVLPRQDSQTEQNYNDEGGKPDACPRDPFVFFCEPAFFSITFITDAVAIHVCLVQIGNTWAVVIDIRNAVAIKILAHITQAISVYISLIRVRDRGT